MKIINYLKNLLNILKKKRNFKYNKYKKFIYYKCVNFDKFWIAGGMTSILLLPTSLLYIVYNYFIINVIKI